MGLFSHLTIDQYKALFFFWLFLKNNLFNRWYLSWPDDGTIEQYTRPCFRYFWCLASNYISYRLIIIWRISIKKYLSIDGFSGPIATILTNKYGCRKMTIIGSILAALGFSASSIFPNLYFYYFSIGIIGGN